MPVWLPHLVQVMVVVVMFQMWTALIQFVTCLGTQSRCISGKKQIPFTMFRDGPWDFWVSESSSLPFENNPWMGRKLTAMICSIDHDLIMMPRGWQHPSPWNLTFNPMGNLSHPYIHRVRVECGLFYTTSQLYMDCLHHAGTIHHLMVNHNRKISLCLFQLMARCGRSRNKQGGNGRQSMQEVTKHQPNPHAQCLC